MTGGATTTGARAGIGRQRPTRFGPRHHPAPQPSATCSTTPVSLTAAPTPAGLITDAAIAGALSATAAATTRPEKSIRIDWSPLESSPTSNRICINCMHDASGILATTPIAMNCCSDMLSRRHAGGAAPFVYWLGSRTFTPQKMDRNRQGAPFRDRMRWTTTRMSSRSRPPSSNGRTLHFGCGDRGSNP
jgi:hypothetical protein